MFRPSSRSTRGLYSDLSSKAIAMALTIHVSSQVSCQLNYAARALNFYDVMPKREFLGHKIKRLGAVYSSRRSSKSTIKR